MLGFRWVRVGAAQVGECWGSSGEGGLGFHRWVSWGSSGG